MSTPISQVSTPQVPVETKTVKNLPVHKALSFKQNPDTFEPSFKLEATNGKKWGIGVLAAVTTGVGGHMANGQYGKAILSPLGIGLGATLVMFGRMAAAGGSKLGILGTVVGGVMAAGTYVWSIVNSVKNAAANVKVVPVEPVYKAVA